VGEEKPKLRVERKVDRPLRRAMLGIAAPPQIDDIEVRAGLARLPDLPRAVCAAEFFRVKAKKKY